MWRVVVCMCCWGLCCSFVVCIGCFEYMDWVVYRDWIVCKGFVGNFVSKFVF